MKIYSKYLSLDMVMKEWECDLNTIQQLVEFDDLKLWAKVDDLKVYELIDSCCFEHHYYCFVRLLHTILWNL